jgi:hypothetical protein
MFSARPPLANGDDEPQTRTHPCSCCSGRRINIEIFEHGCAPQYRPTVANRIGSS